MFNDIDPDVLAVARKVFESVRVNSIRKKHAKQKEEELLTQLELLSDEIAGVIPRNHPAFPVVMLLVIEQKVARLQEPEFKSFLDESLPNPNW